MTDHLRSKSLFRALLLGSLSDKQQFRDAIGLGIVLVVAVCAIEVTSWIGIRVMFWICVVGAAFIGLGLVSALAIQMANPEARSGFVASWRAYRSARRDGAAKPGNEDQG